MGFFTKKSEQEQIIYALTKENKRLKIENVAHEKQEKKLSELIEQYKQLIQRVESLKDDYELRLQLLDELTEGYREELNNIVKKAEKNINAESR